jgi:hypothetical protein
MSLTDLMSAANLDRYAQVALVAFIVAFVFILYRIFAPRFGAAYERARFLPFDQGDAPAPPTDASHR